MGILIDWEDPERSDGERPNRQFRGVADAQVGSDEAGSVTWEITRKYLRGKGGPARARQRASEERVVVRLVPREVVAIASI